MSRTEPPRPFGITQLALALRPGEIEPKEFNLPQLESTDELLSALNQVRDVGLGGKIPPRRRRLHCYLQNAGLQWRSLDMGRTFGGKIVLHPSFLRK
jgi:hypothetical protein